MLLIVKRTKFNYMDTTPYTNYNYKRAWSSGIYFFEILFFPSSHSIPNIKLCIEINITYHWLLCLLSIYETEL